MLTTVRTPRCESAIQPPIALPLLTREPRVRQPRDPQQSHIEVAPGVADERRVAVRVRRACTAHCSARCSHVHLADRRRIEGTTVEWDELRFDVRLLQRVPCTQPHFNPCASPALPSRRSPTTVAVRRRGCVSHADLAPQAPPRSRRAPRHRHDDRVGFLCHRGGPRALPRPAYLDSLLVSAPTVPVPPPVSVLTRMPRSRAQRAGDLQLRLPVLLPLVGQLRLPLRPFQGPPPPPLGPHGHCPR